MNDTHYKIAEAIKRTSDIATEKECSDLLLYSGCETKEELLMKLIKLSAEYVSGVETKEYLCGVYKKNAERYQENFIRACKKHQVSYSEQMKISKESGIYPADKKISCEVVKRLMDEGLTQKQVSEKLGISRSTVCRKLKEAKDKGFNNSPQIKWSYK